MAAFGKDFTELISHGSVNSAKLSQDRLIAINERLSLEHQNLDTGNADPDNASAQGRHKAGAVSAVYIGSSAPSTAATGGLWYDTSTSLLKIYNGSNWTTYSIGAVPPEAQARVFRAYSDTNQTINDDTLTDVVFGVEEYDAAAVWDASNYWINPPENGLYFVHAQVTMQSFAADNYCWAAIVSEPVGGGSISTLLEDQYTAHVDSAVVTLRMTLIRKLYTTGTYYVQAKQVSAGSRTIVKGGEKTIIYGYRICSI